MHSTKWLFVVQTAGASSKRLYSLTVAATASGDGNGSERRGEVAWTPWPRSVAHDARLGDSTPRRAAWFREQASLVTLTIARTDANGAGRLGGDRRWRRLDRSRAVRRESALYSPRSLLLILPAPEYKQRIVFNWTRLFPDFSTGDARAAGVPTYGVAPNCVSYLIAYILSYLVILI